MATKEYRVNTTGRRNLRLTKEDDGNLHLKIMLNDKRLATLVLPPKEWDKLASYSEGLKRK